MLEKCSPCHVARSPLRGPAFLQWLVVGEYREYQPLAPYECCSHAWLRICGIYVHALVPWDSAQDNAPKATSNAPWPEIIKRGRMAPKSKALCALPETQGLKCRMNQVADQYCTARFGRPGWRGIYLFLFSSQQGSGHTLSGRKETTWVLTKTFQS